MMNGKTSTLIAIQTKVYSSHAIQHTTNVSRGPNLTWILSIILVTSQGFPQSALLLISTVFIANVVGRTFCVKQPTRLTWQQLISCSCSKLFPHPPFPGISGTYREASSQAPDMAVVDSCDMPQTISRGFQCAILFPNAWCHESLKMKSFTSLSQAWFRRHFSPITLESNGPKWLRLGIWRMMTHHLKPLTRCIISMSPRHPLKYTVCRNLVVVSTLGHLVWTAHPLPKDSSMDLLQWYQATLQSQEISVKSFKITQHLSHIQSLPISFGRTKDSWLNLQAPRHWLSHQPPRSRKKPSKLWWLGIFCLGNPYIHITFK